MPAGRALLRAGETWNGPQQRLHGMNGRQVDRQAARAEFLVALGVLTRRQQEFFDPGGFFAFRRFEPVETVDQPSVR